MRTTQRKMSKSEKRDRRVAGIAVVLISVFFCYLLIHFSPMWLYQLGKTNGSALIEQVDENNLIIRYSYFNKVDGKKVTNQKHFKTQSEIEHIYSNQSVKISYSNYNSGYVLFENLDKRPPFILSLSISMLALAAIVIYTGVFLGKIPLSIFER